MTTESEKLRPSDTEENIQGKIAIRLAQLPNRLSVRDRDAVIFSMFALFADLLCERDQEIEKLKKQWQNAEDANLKLIEKISTYRKLLDEKDKEMEMLKINPDCQGSHIIPTELNALLDRKDQEIKSLKTRYSELEEQTGVTGKKNWVMQMEIEELVEMLEKVHRPQIGNPFHITETCEECIVIVKYSAKIYTPADTSSSVE